MNSIIGVIGDRKLKHDLGPGKTQTQFLDLYGQLKRGSRWFDIRPCLGNGGQQLLCHYSEVLGVSQSGNGIKVFEAIEMINRFMADYPGELVILDLNTDCAYNSDAGSKSYPRLSDVQWKPIWQTFRDNIAKPCKSTASDLTEVTMNEYIGDGVGCVMTIARGSIPGLTTADANLSKGFYHQNSFLSKGDFSSTDDMQTLAEDQVAKMTLNRALKGSGADGNQDTFFVLHWETTISFDTLDIPLSALAAQAQSSLFWYAYHMFTPYSFPNVIYVDMLGAPFRLPNRKTQDEYMAMTQGHMTALAMAVNLYIASENCNLGGGKIHP